MALSNLDNDNITRLFKMININEQSHNNLMSVRNNYSSYSKLELICKQIEFLKKEAINVIENHNLNIDIENISCNFRKVPGNYYYLYKKNNEKILSMISTNEGNIYDEFIIKLYYDYDNLFHIIQ